ncbi:MAG: DegQ family serine endoprotease [Magnetococcales bacterium]|nr:DegQ family serine endoprotease [Magnetococcales bacterium]
MALLLLVQLVIVPPGRAREMPDLTGLVEELQPVVVNIVTSKKVLGGLTDKLQNPFHGSPFEDFFQPFLDRMPQKDQQSRNMGSGVIIDEEGYILTNHHVIEDADEIKVRLSNEKEYVAKVIGSDAKTDLALIRIETDQKLPKAKLGDSAAIKVGAWVIAVGNPFGLEATVTVGILSAKGRSIGNGPYDDFLQTDAAINPGNSGGPLFDLEGRVIGINTAIYSRSGGYMGIGFAIPINMAKSVVSQLKDSGRVTRGWLGVGIQTVTPELATALGLDEPKGALVSQVNQPGPAHDAGFKPGDVILKFNGKAIHKMKDLPATVASTLVGETVAVEILRDGAAKTLKVKVAEMPPEEATSTAKAAPGKSDPLGMKVHTLSEMPKRPNGIGDEVKGVVVVGVDADGAAARAGIRKGDVIVDLNSRAVATVADYNKALESLGSGKTVLVRILRDNKPLFVAVQR